MKKTNNNMSLQRSALAAVLVLALAGCSSLSQPNITTEKTLGLSQEIQARYSVDEAWWHAYHDENLNQLIDTALANNIDLALSALRINQALYQANLTGVNLTPTLSGSLSGSVKKDLKEGGNSTRSYGGGLNVSYDVDLWRKLADSRDAKVWAYQATVEDKEAMRLSTVYAVIDVYFQLAALQADIQTTQKNIATYQSLLNITQSKYKLGRVAMVEPEQAKQSLLNAQSQLILLQEQYSQSQMALRNLLNIKANGEALTLALPTLGSVKPLGVDLNVPLAVIANRPDLRAAEYRLQQSFKSWQATSKDWYPSISLSAAVNSNDSNIGSALKFPIGIGSIDLRLPFLDWQTVKWNIKISENDYEINRLDFEKTMTLAVNEVAQNYVSYEQALATEKNLSAKLGAETKIARYYQVRYENGKEELSKWLDAQRALQDTQLSLQKSSYARIQAENLVYKSMAGRYQQN